MRQSLPWLSPVNAFVRRAQQRRKVRHERALAYRIPIAAQVEFLETRAMLSPQITGISPSEGGTGGGTNVEIYGSGLMSTMCVFFGDSATNTFTIHDDVWLTATSPAHAAGSVDIVTMGMEGMSPAVPASQFVYLQAAAPAISAVSPSTGSLSGGTSVVITGSGLDTVTTVMFGGTAAQSFTINSPNSITAISPAGNEGTVDLMVSGPNGMSATTSASQFSYTAAPVVTGIGPNSGPANGGTTVSVYGAGFSNVLGVYFGGTYSSSIEVVTSSLILATAPAHAAGTASVTVATTAGTSQAGPNSAYEYTVPPPAITQVSPLSVSTAGGQVTISGQNFVDVNAIWFGNTAATNYTVNSATSISVTAPPHAAGTYDVTIDTATGSSQANALARVTYAVPPPAVTGLSSTSGTVDGGEMITLSGSHFTGASSVTFGSVSASFQVMSDSTIHVTAPAHAAGTFHVVVTTDAGASSAVDAARYTFVHVNHVPTFSSPGNQTSSEGASISFQVNAGDVDGDTLTYSLSGAPAGLSISSSGVISGTILYTAAETQSGGYIAVVEVSDGQGASADVSFTWTVNNTYQSPVVLGPAAQSSAEGAVISLDPTVDNPEGNPLMFSATGLPAGLSINNITGRISGVIAYSAAQTQSGSYSVQVTAMDSHNASGSRTFAWSVADTPRAPVLTNPGTRNDGEGEAISLQIQAVHPDSRAMSYSATWLPAGLSLNTATGVISGTIAYSAAETNDGDYTISVSVSDALDLSASASFQWTVANEIQPPTIENPGPQSSAEGAAVSLAISASDAEGYTLSFSAEGLPSGLSINPQSGVITGVVGSSAAQTSNGSYTATVVANDGHGRSSRVLFAWSVSDTAQSEVRAPDDQQNAEGDALMVFFTVVPGSGQGGGSGGWTYTADNLPGGLTISPSTGYITGTIESDAAQVLDGIYDVTITATNANEDVESAEFVWTISDTPQAPVLSAIGPQTTAEGASVSLALEASDADGRPLTFSASGLPGGLSVNPNTGVISGGVSYHAAQAWQGHYQVIVSVHDDRGLSASQLILWDISDTYRQPVLPSPGGQFHREGAVVSLPMAGVAPEGNALTYSTLSLPAGLSIDSATGLISGQIGGAAGNEQNGVYEVTITAMDLQGGAATRSLTWTVYDVTAAPVVSSLALLHNTGTAEEPETDEPELIGSVSNPEGTSYTRPVYLQFDYGDGNIDGSTDMASNGTFQMNVGQVEGEGPGIEEGEVTVKARAFTTDAATGDQIFGEWTALTFTYSPSAASGNGGNGGNGNGGSGGGETGGLPSGPVANTDYFETRRNQPITISPSMLTANDLSLSGRPLRAVAVSGNGTINPDGSFTWDPGPGLALSQVSFSYTLTDGVSTTTGSASIGTYAGKPWANKQLVVRTAGISNEYTFAVSGTDPDSYPLSYIVSGNNVAPVPGHPHAFKYTAPTADWFGTVKFPFKVSNGVNDSHQTEIVLSVYPPASYTGPAVHLQDFIAGDGQYFWSGGALQIPNSTGTGTISYTPSGAANFMGEELTYSKSDAYGNSDTGKIVIEPTIIKPARGGAWWVGPGMQGEYRIATEGGTTYLTVVQGTAFQPLAVGNVVWSGQAETLALGAASGSVSIGGFFMGGFGNGSVDAQGMVLGGGNMTVTGGTVYEAYGNNLSISVSGSVGRVVAGDGTVTINAGGAVGDVTALTTGMIQAGGSVGNVTAATIGQISAGGNVGNVSGGTVSKITAQGSIGDIRGNVSVTGPIASMGGSIGEIAGGQISGPISSNAAIASIHSNGNISGIISAVAGMGTVHANGDLSGKLTAGTGISSIWAGGNLSSLVDANGGDIGQISAVGGITSAAITVAGDIGSIWSLGTIDSNVSADGSIVAVTSSLSLIEKSVTAGVNIGSVWAYAGIGATLTTEGGFIGDITALHGGIGNHISGKTGIGNILAYGSITKDGDDGSMLSISTLGEIRSIKTDGFLHAVVSANDNIGDVWAGQEIKGGITSIGGKIGNVTTDSQLLASVIAKEDVGSVRAMHDISGSVSSLMGSVAGVTTTAGSILGDVHAKLHLGSVHAGLDMEGDVTSDLADIEDVIAGTAGASGFGNISGAVQSALGVGAIKALTPIFGEFVQGPDPAGEAAYRQAIEDWLADADSTPADLPKFPRLAAPPRSIGGNISGSITVGGSLPTIVANGALSGDVDVAEQLGSVWALRDVSGSVESGSGAVTLTTYGKLSGDVQTDGNFSGWAYDDVTGDINSARGEAGVGTWGEKSGDITAKETAAVWAYDSISGEVASQDASTALTTFGDLMASIFSFDVVDLQTGGTLGGSIESQHGGIFFNAKEVQTSLLKAYGWVKGYALEDIQANVPFAAGYDVKTWGNVSGTVNSLGNVSIQALKNVSATITATGGGIRIEGKDVSGTLTTVMSGEAATDVRIKSWGTFSAEVVSASNVSVSAFDSLSGSIKATENVKAFLMGGGQVVTPEGGGTPTATAPTGSLSASIEAKGSIDVTSWGDIMGALSAYENSKVFAYGNVNGNVTIKDLHQPLSAHQNLKLITWGSLNGAIDVGRDADVVSFGDTSGNITAGDDIKLVTRGRMLGNLMATAPLPAGAMGDEEDRNQRIIVVYADGDVIGDVSSLQDVSITAYGDVTSTVVATTGDAAVTALVKLDSLGEGSTPVGGSVTGNVTAGKSVSIQSSGGISSGQVKADNDNDGTGSAKLHAHLDITGVQITSGQGAEVVSDAGVSGVQVTAGISQVATTTWVNGQMVITLSESGNPEAGVAVAGLNAVSGVTVQAGGDIALSAGQSATGFTLTSLAGGASVGALGTLQGTVTADKGIGVSSFNEISGFTATSKHGSINAFVAGAINATLTAGSEGASGGDEANPELGGVSVYARDDVQGTYKAAGPVSLATLLAVNGVTVTGGTVSSGTATPDANVTVGAGLTISGTIRSETGSVTVVSSGTSSDPTAEEGEEPQQAIPDVYVSATVWAFKNADVEAAWGSVTGAVTASTGNSEVYSADGITAAVTAGGTVTVSALGNISGGATIQAGGSATVETLQELSASVTSSNGSVTVSATAVSGAISARVNATVDAMLGNVIGTVTATLGNANVTSLGSITSNVTAGANADVFAQEDIQGDVTAGGTASVGSLIGALLGNVSAGQTVNVEVFGDVLGTVSAGMDALVDTLGSIMSSITAGRDAIISASGSLGGTVGAGRDADVSASSGIMGNITATTGDVTATTFGSVVNTVNAGDSADVFAGGSSAIVTINAQAATLQSFGITVANVMTTAGANVLSTGVLAGSLMAGGDAEVMAFDASTILVDAGGDASVIARGNYTGSVSAGGDASVSCLGTTLAGNIAAQGDVSALSLGNFLGSVTAGGNASAVAYGTSLSIFTVSGDSSATALASGAYDGTVESSDGDAAVIILGNGSVTLVAGQDSFALGVGTLDVQMNAARDGVVISVGNLAGSVSAGRDGTAVSYDTLDLTVNAGQDAVVGAVGSATATVNAGRNAYLTTLDWLDANVTAGNDIGNILAVGSITGTFVAGHNIEGITSFGTIDGTFVAGADQLLSNGGEIGSVSAMGAIAGSITATTSIGNISSGDAITASIVAPAVGNESDHSETIMAVLGAAPGTPNSPASEIQMSMMTDMMDVSSMREDLDEMKEELLDDVHAARELTTEDEDEARQQSASDAADAVIVAVTGVVGARTDATNALRSARTQSKQDKQTAINEFWDAKVAALNQRTDSINKANEKFDAAVLEALNEKQKKDGLKTEVDDEHVRVLAKVLTDKESYEDWVNRLSTEFKADVAAMLASITPNMNIENSTFFQTYAQGERLYDEFLEDGYTPAEATFLMLRCLAADRVGVTNLFRAFYGEDPYTLENFGVWDRVFFGVLGTVQIVSTAMGIQNALRPGPCGGWIFERCFVAGTYVHGQFERWVTVDVAAQVASTRTDDDGSTTLNPALASLCVIIGIGGPVASRGLSRKRRSDDETARNSDASESQESIDVNDEKLHSLAGLFTRDNLPMLLGEIERWCSVDFHGTAMRQTCSEGPQGEPSEFWEKGTPESGRDSDWQVPPTSASRLNADSTEHVAATKGTRQFAWDWKASFWAFAWMALGAWIWPFSTENAPRAARPLNAAVNHTNLEKMVLDKLPVEDVRDGDQVNAFDEITGQIVLRPVVRTFQRKSDHLRFVHFEGADGETQTIGTTDEHPFWVHGQGWVPAEALTEGQILNHLCEGEHALLLGTRYERRTERVSVFNFEVEGAHNYFVSDSPDGLPVLVHNACERKLGGLDAIADGTLQVVKSTAWLVREARTEAHHVFTEYRKKWFKRRYGIDVDDFVVDVDRLTHEALHSGKGARALKNKAGWWDYELMNRVKNATEIKGSKLTASEVIAIGARLVDDLIPGHGPIHPLP